MNQENQNNVNHKLVIIATIFITIVAISFCVLLYFNKIRTVSIKLDDFEVIDNIDKSAISNISNKDGKLIIEGNYTSEVKTYQIYIGIEDNNGKIKIYPTEMKEENQFYTSILSNKVASEDKIKIIYMCDNEKLIIDTHKIVGDTDE